MHATITVCIYTHSLVFHQFAREKQTVQPISAMPTIFDSPSIYRSPHGRTAIIAITVVLLAGLTRRTLADEQDDLNVRPQWPQDERRYDLHGDRLQTADNDALDTELTIGDKRQADRERAAKSYYERFKVPGCFIILLMLTALFLLRLYGEL